MTDLQREWMAEVEAELPYSEIGQVSLAMRRVNRVMLTEIGGRAFGSLRQPSYRSPVTRKPDLYVIECSSTGAVSDALTLAEVAITLGELARKSHACVKPHTITPAEKYPSF